MSTFAECTLKRFPMTLNRERLQIVLVCRISLRKTGVHFAGPCSRSRLALVLGRRRRPEDAAAAVAMRALPLARDQLLEARPARMTLELPRLVIEPPQRGQLLIMS